jgi:hypothetical protein
MTSVVLCRRLTQPKGIIMSTTQSKVNALVANYLKASDTIVIELHSLGLDTPDLQRPFVIKAVCAALTKGEGWNESSTGKVMLDSKYARYEFLNTRVRRVMDALKGEKGKTKSSGKTDPVDALLRAFKKLDAKQQRAVLKALA